MRAVVKAYTYDAGFISYAVQVSETGAPAGESWLVSRRYSEFLELFRALQQQGGSGTGALQSTPFPVKGIPNKSDAQLEKRRQQLDRVLQAILACQPLRPQLRTMLHEFLDVERQLKLLATQRRVTIDNAAAAGGGGGGLAAFFGLGGGGGPLTPADRSLRKFWSMLAALLAALVAAQPTHAVAVCACFASGLLTALVSVRHEPLQRLQVAASTGGGASTAGASSNNSSSSSGSSGSGGGGGQVSRAAYLRVAEGALSKAAAALDPLSDGYRQHSVSQGVTVFLKDVGPLTYALGQAVLPVAPWAALQIMTDGANKGRVDPSWKKDTELDVLPHAALDRSSPSAAADDDAATTGRVGVSCRVLRTEMKSVLMTGARDLVTVLSCCYDRDAGAIFRVAASTTHAAAPVDSNYVRANCFCVGFAMQRATAAQAAAAGLTGAAAENATLMTHMTMMDPNGAIPKWVVSKSAPQRALAPLRLLSCPSMKEAAAATARGDVPIPAPEWWTRAANAMGAAELGGGGAGDDDEEEEEEEEDESKSEGGQGGGGGGGGGGGSSAAASHAAAARTAWNTLRAAANCSPAEAGWKLHSNSKGVQIYLSSEGAIVKTMARGTLPAPPRAVAGAITSEELKPQTDLNWKQTERVQGLDKALFDEAGAKYRTVSLAVEHSLFKPVLITAARDVLGVVAVTVTPVKPDDAHDAEPDEIIIALCSVEHPERPPTPDYVRATVSVGGFVLRAVPGSQPGEVHTQVTNLTVMDAGGSIPSWVTNRVAPQRGAIIVRLGALTEVSDPPPPPRARAHTFALAQSVC
jgi:hypothetical protein